MIKCSIVRDDFVLINIPMDYCQNDLDRLMEYIKSVKDYKFPIIDLTNMIFPNIYVFELLLSVYQSFSLESKMVLINASSNYKRAFKLYAIEELFIFKADEYEAIIYYKAYTFKKLWNI